mmetsp:Transcript_17771/g.41971  ORF Transcript_17771/g.41971 Transcript_17771/m.41971 type:complete len:169 (-) Transcript_17771:412-918(-)
MPRSNRKRQPVAALDDDVEMVDAENSSSAKKPSASSPDPTQPSPSKRPRQGRRSRSASPRKSKKKPPPKLKVNIKRFHGVARWSWNVGGAAARANEFGGAGGGDGEEEDDVCGICQNAFEGVAPGMKYPGDDCPLERGPCNHCFHLQCVNKWLSTKKTCPICRAEWPT